MTKLGRSVKYEHSAKANDYGCPGSMGIRVKFHPPGGGTKYSDTKWVPMWLPPMA